MPITILKNPTQSELDVLLPYLQEEKILEKIKKNNIRIEFINKQDYALIILYLPEYNADTKSITSTEVDIYYEKKDNNAFIFAYNTLYFFDKYGEDINSIKFTSFGVFIRKFLDILLEDEAQIVDHILEDTEKVKNEYNLNLDSYEIIRHLTRNEINISSLKLISANQNKLIALLEKHLSDSAIQAIDYKRSYVAEELDYEHEFCKTLMDSINTKFQVKSSEELYRFTKYSFMVFVATLAVAFLTLIHADDTTGKTYTFLGLISILLSVILVHRFFK
jgi:hypothetical protein